MPSFIDPRILCFAVRPGTTTWEVRYILLCGYGRLHYLYLHPVTWTVYCHFVSPHDAVRAYAGLARKTFRGQAIHVYWAAKRPPEVASPPIWKQWWQRRKGDYLPVSS